MWKRRIKLPERAGKIGGSPPRIYDELRFHHNKNKKTFHTNKPSDNIEGSGPKPKTETNGQKEALDSCETIFHKVPKHRGVINTLKASTPPFHTDERIPKVEISGNSTPCPFARIGDNSFINAQIVKPRGKASGTFKPKNGQNTTSANHPLNPQE